MGEAPSRGAFRNGRKASALASFRCRFGTWRARGNRLKNAPFVGFPKALRAGAHAQKGETLWPDPNI